MSKYLDSLHTIAMIHGIDGLVSDFANLEELILKFEEQESRKDKLVVGSKWECIVTSYIDVEGHFMIQGERVSVNEIISDMYVCFSDLKNTKLTYDTFIEQFLHCFKPIDWSNEE